MKAKTSWLYFLLVAVLAGSLAIGFLPHIIGRHWSLESAPLHSFLSSIRALAKINPSVKVIATSGMDTERMMAGISGVPLEAFLQKPFTAERLLRKLAEVLKG